MKTQSTRDEGKELDTSGVTQSPPVKPLEPGRGKLILLLGLLGILTVLLGVALLMIWSKVLYRESAPIGLVIGMGSMLSISAFIIGYKELKKRNSDTLRLYSRAFVRAGMILGIIGTTISLLTIFAFGLGTEGGWEGFFLVIWLIGILLLIPLLGILTWLNGVEIGKKARIVIGMISTVLGAVIYLFAVMVVFSMPFMATVESAKDGMINDLNNLFANAYQYRVRSLEKGGGGGSYEGYKIPQTLAENENGIYTVAVVSRDSLTLQGKSEQVDGTIEVKTGPDGRPIGTSWKYGGDFR
jgi:hypothetical protein